MGQSAYCLSWILQELSIYVISLPPHRECCTSWRYAVSFYPDEVMAKRHSSNTVVAKRIKSTNEVHGIASAPMNHRNR
jgi:hypothetical protein